MKKIFLALKRHDLFIIYYSLFILLCSCNPYRPSTYRGMPKEYTSVWEERYGRCYDSVPHCIVALDLYSEGLELDTAARRMQGTGYNLYLSDIILPDRTGDDSLRLAPGDYHSATTAEPFTFLPGRDYEGTPHGIYLLYVEEGKLQSIQVLDSGYLTVKDTTNGLTDLQFTLYYKNAYGSRATYRPHFQGALQWQKK